ncbi:MAG: hypothetical protein HUJ53_05455 [Holdemanella sp.]|nr:hypothetical protein [Holdemanella sp.]
MIVGIICLVGYIVVMLIINERKMKNLGNCIFVTKSVLQKREKIQFLMRGAASLLLAGCVIYIQFIKNKIGLYFFVALLSLYAARVIFPLFFYARNKDKLGIYENAVVGYEGIMEYAHMKKYTIDFNKKNTENDQKMTIYCKSNIPINSAIVHLDIEERLVRDIHSFFRKKHKDIQKVTKKK